MPNRQQWADRLGLVGNVVAVLFILSVPGACTVLMVWDHDGQAARDVDARRIHYEDVGPDRCYFRPIEPTPMSCVRR